MSDTTGNGSTGEGRRVVVVGGGITGLTTALTLRSAGADVVVCEAADRLGGKILTTEIAGTRVDAGPDAFLVRQPHATQLADELHLGDALVAPATGAARLWLDGALRPLPRRQYLGVPLDLDEPDLAGILSAEGLAVARTDLDRPADGPVGDESVGSLVRRRLGDEVMDRLVGPLLGGINAGDPDQLSLEAGVPQLAEAAGHDASLVKSVRDHLRAAARPADSPVFLTHPDGLGRFVTTIETRLGDAVRTGCPVRGIEPNGGRWLVHTDTELVDADAVVLTTPTFASAALVRDIAPHAAAALDRIDHASVVMVTLAYRAGDLPDDLGSGFLVPREEGLLMTACSWASSKWAHLAEGTHRFARVSAGRIDDPRFTDLDDDDLVETLCRELSWTAGVDAAPDEIRITRWPHSFPQYRPGHADLVASIDRLLADEAPGLVATGAGHRGLGIPACIHQARVAALSSLPGSSRIR